MSEEQPQSQQSGRREKKPPIGGIGQYATLGGTSRRSDAPPSKLPEGQTLSYSNAQTSQSSDAPPSKLPEGQALSSSSAQTSKREKPKRNKQTVYLEDDVDRWIRHRIADTREEISDVVNAAVRRLMQG